MECLICDKEMIELASEDNVAYRCSKNHYRVQIWDTEITYHVNETYHFSDPDIKPLTYSVELEEFDCIIKQTRQNYMMQHGLNWKKDGF